MWADAGEPVKSEVSRVGVISKGWGGRCPSRHVPDGIQCSNDAHSLFNTAQGPVSSPHTLSITQTNDADYTSVLLTAWNAARAGHARLLLRQWYPTSYVCSLVMHGVFWQYWAEVLCVSLHQAAVPCHEGPHRACCERGRVHSKQTEGGRRSQACRVWGMGDLPFPQLHTLPRGPWILRPLLYRIWSHGI